MNNTIMQNWLILASLWSQDGIRILEMVHTVFVQTWYLEYFLCVEEIKRAETKPDIFWAIFRIQRTFSATLPRCLRHKIQLGDTPTCLSYNKDIYITVLSLLLVISEKKKLQYPLNVSHTFRRDLVDETLQEFLMGDDGTSLLK